MSIRTAKDPRRGKFGRSAFYVERSERRARRFMADIATWAARFPDADPEKGIPRPWKVAGRIHRKAGR